MKDIMQVIKVAGNELPLTDWAKENIRLTIDGIREVADMLSSALAEDNSLKAYQALLWLLDGAHLSVDGMRQELTDIIADRLPDILKKLASEDSAPAEATTTTKGGE